MKRGLAEAADRRHLGTFVCDEVGGIESETLGYTYEIWIPRGDNVTGALRILDLAIQDTLTSALNAQYEGGDGICEVAARRDDRRDGSTGQCSETFVYPTYIGACANSQCDLVCTPIIGSSVVTFDADLLDADRVDQLVQEKLTEIMLRDELLEGSGSIKKVVYAERLPVVAGFVKPRSEKAEEQHNNNFSAGTIAGVVVGMVLLAIMVFNAILACRGWRSGGGMDVKDKHAIDGHEFFDEEEASGDEVGENKRSVSEQHEGTLSVKEDASASTSSTGEVEEGEAAAILNDTAPCDGVGSTITTDKDGGLVTNGDVSESNVAMFEDTDGFEISYR